MPSTTDKLLDLKQQIEDAKTSKAQAEGRLQQLKKELLEKFGCKTVKAAQTKLVKMEKQIKDLTESLKIGMAELDEQYDFAD